jgi:hypothetical protein
VARDLDHWTILCGADDAAVVATYRTFKQLLEADPQIERRKPGVMVMGADEVRAQATADKLNAAARSFLHVPIELLGMRKRMVPVNVEPLGSFAQKPALWRQIGGALGEAFEATWQASLAAAAVSAADSSEARIDPPAHVKAAAPAPAPEPAPLVAEVPRLGDAPALPDTAPRRSEVAEAPDPAPAIDVAQPPVTWTAAVAHAGFPAESASIVSSEPEALAQEPEPEPEPEPEDEPAAAPPALAEAPAAHAAPPLFGDADDEGDDAVTAAAPPPPSHAPTPTSAPVPVEAHDQPDLLALIANQGLRGGESLAAQCPRHPDTQLALDDAGRFHLLRRHAGDEDLRTAVTDLLDAQAWVIEHRQLLQLTCPQRRVDRQAQPVLHLFTDQAKAAVKLTAGAGQLVKLRLLQPVQVRGQTAWVCVELN